MSDVTGRDRQDDLLAASSVRVPEQRVPAHVVVGVQGDDSSVAALRWAGRFADARGADVEALMAWELPEPPEHAPAGVHEVAQGVVGDLWWALEAIVARSGLTVSSGARLTTTVVTAPARVALADAVRRASLLVLGSAHHSAALAALSVARQLAASAECPVVLVPAHGPEEQSAGDRLVVGMDGSPQSKAALRWACEDGERRGLPVRVVMVSLAEAARQGVVDAVAAEGKARPALSVTVIARGGSPAEVLIGESQGAEALVLGQHGSDAISRRLPALGSVSRACAAHPVDPVVIVPWRRKRAGAVPGAAAE